MTLFTLDAELPCGTTVIEASAGTGKTFTIAALVTRFLAEGRVSMDRLLVVSFSRDSTRELRSRVREQLVSARDGLLASPTPKDDPDPLGDLLRDGTPDEVATRIERLAAAVDSFDAATVTTTHGFCEQALRTLGTSVDHDPAATLVESLDDLVLEVADDLYLRKWWPPGSESPALSHDEFRDLARSVATDPATRLAPERDAAGDAGLRRKIGDAVREEFEQRKRRRRLIGYDDLLIRLAKALTDPDCGAGARARLRDRYHVVLVDEFQDTDPVQWAILHDAFHGHCPLVLVGDPKQAIYRFRGADVHSYLAALDSSSTHLTLGTSRRSDAALLHGLDAVLHGAALGDARIRAHPLTAHHPGRLVQGVAPVRLRVLSRDDLKLGQRGLASVDPARQAVTRDLVVQILDLLGGAARLVPRSGAPSRPVLPGDIAVLVYSHAQARMVEEALQGARIPAVLTGRTSVFASDAAEQWQLLLEALEATNDTSRVRRLALGCFVGKDAASLDAWTDADVDDLSLTVRRWRSVFEDRGVAALFEQAASTYRLQARVLGTVGGERLLTDLRHIAQVLHQAAIDGSLGLGALLSWLRRRRGETTDDGQVERSRRLATDAAAVQVLTVHTSKGLEFPVVLLPFGWDRFDRRTSVTALCHDQTGQRIRDVGGRSGPDWAAHYARHQQEEADDHLRLFYVAATRAESHLVLWWAPTTNTPTSPLHRLLLHDDPQTVAPRSIDVPDDATARAAFDRRAAASQGALLVQQVSPQNPGAWAPPAVDPLTLELAATTRSLEPTWERTSYSALTAAAHQAHYEAASLASEPEAEQLEDEPTERPALDAVVRQAHEEALRAVPSLWDALPGGRGFGTLVHAAMEQVDDLADPVALRASVALQVARHAPGTDVDLLTQALLAATGTPLGALADGMNLAKISPRDRLPELSFELPLGGGDADSAAAGRPSLLNDLAPLWREHCPTGLLSGYADALADLPATSLHGYLTGSIDVVLRVGSPDRPRYLVVDYKTNRLGTAGQPLTAEDYRLAAMEQAMIQAHYPLQALLYGVALHRYLRWRQPGYHPAVHLGGMLYLFVRGMCGPDVVAADGTVPGVFAWRPPDGLVTGASDLLAGGSR